MNALTFWAALLGFAAMAVPAHAQDTRDAGLYAPSIWDLQIGAHASELPAEEYINFACGTNGGPPSLALKGWTEFLRCTPEAVTRLREVYFRYDDEPEYWAKARNLLTQAALYEYTSAYEIPIIASALFDANGFLAGIRIVTDARVPVEKREKGAALATYLRIRYGDNGWACVDLPRLDGEQPYAGQYLKRLCKNADAAAGYAFTLEAHYYRKPGQRAIDPITNQPTEGQFESTTRFELLVVRGVPNPEQRLAEIAAKGPPPPSPRQVLADRARNCQAPCDLRGADLKRADLGGANLAGADLTGANLHGAVLAGANLASAILERANLNRADIKRADLRNATMRHALMFEARFDASNMAGADLTEALAGKVQLIGANLTGAKMVAMDLRNARMNDAKYAGADLRGSWMHDAQMTRSDFTGANFDSAVMWNVNLVQAKLGGADMRSADLIRANLRGADCTATDFRWSRLAFANLQDTIVTAARWEEAELPFGFAPK